MAEEQAKSIVWPMIEASCPFCFDARQHRSQHPGDPLQQRAIRLDDSLPLGLMTPIQHRWFVSARIRAIIASSVPFNTRCPLDHLSYRRQNVIPRLFCKLKKRRYAAE
ncbi:MAG: hypothetical protein WCC66_10730 [Rhizobiaceae bacterium]